MGGMEKTTVYLPEELKTELARTALESGRSEADLIREGVRAVVGQAADPEPILPLYDSAGAGLARNVDEALEGFGED